MAISSHSHVRTKGSDLNLRFAIHNQDDAKTGAYAEAVGEKRLHAIGTGVGSYIVIGRLASQLEIAHASATKYA